MTEALARVWARRIHAGVKSYTEVEQVYGRQATNMVYLASSELYGDEHKPLEPFIVEE